MQTELLSQVIAGEAPELMRLTVEQYHQMLAAGIFHDGDPVELIDGFLVWKDRRDSGRMDMNHGPVHAATVNRLFHVVYPQVDGQGCHAQCQLPITVPPRHEPEPDVSVVEGEPDDYRDHLPTADDALAVMEVADSSARFDRTTKQRLYADAGIPVYLLVDLAAGHIEAYTAPVPGEGRYAHCETCAAGQMVTIRLRNGVTLEIPAADILS